MSQKSQYRTLALVAIGMALAFQGGCSQAGSPSATQNLPRAVSNALARNVSVDARLVDANTDFGIKLFQELNKSAGGKNLFLSPLSISLALQILYNGAGGDTKTAMDAALSLNSLSATDLNAMNAALQASLVNPDKAVQLQIANGLWFKKEVKPDFVSVNTEYYGSELGDMTGVPNVVNAWVKEKTSGKITSILPNQNYADTVAILVNAIYFKGGWSAVFDEAQTTDGIFTKGDGTTKTVRYMRQTETLKHFTGANFHALRLPYGSGRMSMYLFLPNANVSLDSFLATLTPQNWTDWMGQFREGLGTIEIPRFKTEYSASLKEALTALGMGIAFDPTGRANLNGVAEGAYIQFVQHKAYVEVTEKGTEAAGATGIGIGVTSAPAPFTFKANRPFFCAIRDDKTGAILFMGAIVDPTF